MIDPAETAVGVDTRIHEFLREAVPLRAGSRYKASVSGIGAVVVAAA